MVAFNLFADLALKGERCVFVRFGHRNEEDFQFDTLVENGCSVQMMDGPNTLEVGSVKDSGDIDRIIIDLPSTVSIPALVAKTALSSSPFEGEGGAKRRMRAKQASVTT